MIFACIHNAGRSQMARPSSTQAPTHRRRARSVGTEPGENVHPPCLHPTQHLELGDGGRSVAPLQAPRSVSGSVGVGVEPAQRPRHHRRSTARGAKACRPRPARRAPVSRNAARRSPELREQDVLRAQRGELAAADEGGREPATLGDEPEVLAYPEPLRSGQERRRETSRTR